MRKARHDDSRATHDVGACTLPMTLFVMPDGKIASTIDVAMTPSDLRASIERARKTRP